MNILMLNGSSKWICVQISCDKSDGTLTLEDCDGTLYNTKRHVLKVTDIDGNFIVKKTSDLYMKEMSRFSHYDKYFILDIFHNVTINKLNILSSELKFNLPLPKSNLSLPNDEIYLIKQYIISQLHNKNIRSKIRRDTGIDINTDFVYINININVSKHNTLDIQLDENIIFNEINSEKYVNYINLFKKKSEIACTFMDPFIIFEHIIRHFIKTYINNNNVFVNIVPVLLSYINTLCTDIDRAKILPLVQIVINIFVENQLVHKLLHLVYEITRISVSYFYTNDYMLFLKQARLKENNAFDHKLIHGILDTEECVLNNYNTLGKIIFHIESSARTIAKFSILSKKHYVQSRKIYKVMMRQSIYKLANIDAVYIIRLEECKNDRLLLENIRRSFSISNDIHKSSSLKELKEYYILKYIESEKAESYRTGGHFRSLFNRLYDIETILLHKIIEPYNIELNTRRILLRRNKLLNFKIMEVKSIVTKLNLQVKSITHNIQSNKKMINELIQSYPQIQQNGDIDEQFEHIYNNIYIVAT